VTSPYPRDDFDAVDPPRDGRRGAHRAAPPRSHGFVAPLVVAAVVAVAGVAGYAALDLGGSAAAASSAAPAGGEQTAGEPVAGAPADPAAGADDAPVDPAAAAPAEVDRSTPVVVLNGTGTKGLAATTATAVEAAGWTVSSTGNASAAQRSAHSSTVVLYPSADLEAGATALAGTVAGEAVLDASAAAGTLTAVLR
jgi:hypothetical protein